MEELEERDNRAFVLISSVSAIIAGVVLFASVLLGGWDTPSPDGTPVQGGADTPTPSRPVP